MWEEENVFVWSEGLGGFQGLYMVMQKIDFSAYICQSSSLWCDEEDKIINYLKNLKHIDFEKLPELVTKKCKIMYEIIKDKPHISARIFEGAHDYFYWQEDLINALKILKEKL